MTENQQIIDLAIADLRDAAKLNLFTGYEKYLKTYFPHLVGEAVGDNLVFKNRTGTSIAIFQDAGDKFRIADSAKFLDIGGGASRDVRGLFDEIARLNSGK